MVALAWLFEGQQREASRDWSQAELLLSGAPQLAGQPQQLRALALAYTGEFPVTPDGTAFEWSEHGLTDPARGSRHIPRWPAIPVQGSPLAQVLDALLSARSELAIDDEPGNLPDGERNQSLRTRVRFRLSR